MKRKVQFYIIIQKIGIVSAILAVALEILISKGILAIGPALKVIVCFLLIIAFISIIVRIIELRERDRNNPNPNSK